MTRLRVHVDHSARRASGLYMIKRSSAPQTHLRHALAAMCGRHTLRRPRPTPEVLPEAARECGA